MPSEFGVAIPDGMSGRSSAGPDGASTDSIELARACEQLELVRRRCLMPLMKRMAVSAAAIAALAGSMTGLSTYPDPFVIGIVSAIAALILWVYWARLPREDYRDFYRAHFIPAAVRALGRYDYDPNGTMPRLWMGRSGLLPEHHVYLSQGLFSAERSGIAVQFAQAELRRHGTYPTTYGQSQGAAPGLAFGGLVILLSLRTAFAGRTVLCRDRGPLFNLFKDSPRDLNVVRPGLKTARGRYEILSTDPDEARSLLDKGLVERLHDSIRALGGRRFRVSFYDSQVLVMVPLKTKLFRAPSIFRRPARNATSAILVRRFEAMDEVVETLHRKVAASS